MRKQLGVAPSAATDAATKTYVDTGLAGKQDLDSDLTTLAGLTATTDNFIQAKSSAWASRTLAQVKPDILGTRNTFYQTDDFASGSTGSSTIGALGWNHANATLAYQNATAGRIGILRLSTGASAGTVAGISPAITASGPFLASEIFDATFIVKIVDNDSDTQIRAGVWGSITGDASANGIYFEKLYADTSWFGVTRSGGVQTRSSAVASTSTSWVVLRVRRIDASTVGFTIDGGSEVTQATNLPGSVIVQPTLQIKNQSAVSKSVDIDYYDLLITGLSR